MLFRAADRALPFACFFTGEAFRLAMS
jgi:hypothetical protein